MIDKRKEIRKREWKMRKEEKRDCWRGEAKMNDKWKVNRITEKGDNKK